MGQSGRHDAAATARSSLFGLQPIIVTTEFDTGTQTTTSGTNGGNAGGFVPAGGVYGVYAILPELKVGASLNSYVGGALDYDDNWVGRYYTTEAELLTFNLNPVIAYRVLPWLSLGAGFSVQWAKLKSGGGDQQRPRPAARRAAEVRGHQLRLRRQLSARCSRSTNATRVGITYRSQVDQSFDDVPSFGQLGPGLQARSAARRRARQLARPRHDHAAGGHAQRLSARSPTTSR